VVKTEYGVNKRWYWPFIAPYYKWNERRSRLKSNDIENTGIVTQQEIIQADKGNSTSSTQNLGDDSPALVASCASKHFAKQSAIQDISFSVASDEILALLGPNGAGKSTLVNCALGLYKLSSGTIQINGFDITRDHDQVYRHIGVCPQHEILWPDLTPKEHLLFYCRLKGIEPKMEGAVVTQHLQDVDLLSEQNKLSKELSGGQKRRLGIAIAFVAKPAVAFLDEPTTGIFTISWLLIVGLDPHSKRHSSSMCD
jgi:ABC-type branched-subunit amino acid transport system ATPase component